MMNIRMLFMLLLMISAPVSAGQSPLFVTTDWVAQHKDDKDVVLVDMSGDTQYSRFHIPGAISLDYGYLVMRRKKDKVSVRVDDKTLYEVLGLTGISRDSHVVIYDDFGGLHAGRLYWELERIGHQRMSIVNGGLVSWILENRKVTNVPGKPLPVKYVPGKGGRDNEIDKAGVIAAMSDGKTTIIDVRSEDEYKGYPRFPRTGHVPGAKWMNWEDNVDIGNGYVLTKSDKLMQELVKLGVKDKQEPLVLYCNSGHRASQSYLTLRSLGFENIRLYDGSMAEYGQDKQAPLKQGMQP
jgi:thiosulfate/3-mercaptopyruvate sulfurtransferase